MLLSFYLAFISCISLASAAPSCGLVPPKPVSHSSAQVVNSTDDVVAAMWWPGWRNAEQPPNKISWSKYNVATYAFALPTENGSLSMPDDPDNVILPQFVSLAQENNVKALVSIGGYTGSRFFSALVNPDNRTNFVNTCYEFMTNNSLDGLDFDWEYPGGGGMSCNLASGNDSNNLFAFIHELRAKMGSDKMITLSVRATPFTDTDGDLSGLAADVDHIAIMDYDIWGSWSPTTGPNAPLDDSCAATKAGSATSSVREWSATNFPVDKIVLGVPAYGHGFNVSSTNALTANNSISVYASFTGIPFGPNDNATATPQPDICGDVSSAPTGFYYFEQMISSGFLDQSGSPLQNISYQIDPCSQTPFVYDSSSSIMISFDDAKSFAAKGQFINDKGLKGFAMWDSSGDFNDILLDSISGAMGIEQICS
ncbi:hypothetical protein H2248_011647 [Termitomyces sp. 'cryptogamus']|nr:hypothetical protein H2248_011647 [Termitomyces sp. 'cryptogamus']